MATRHNPTSAPQTSAGRSATPLTLAAVAALLALCLAIAAAPAENPLADPIHIPPPPVTPAAPATPANPNPDIFRSTPDDDNTNNPPAPSPSAKPDAAANLPTETPLTDCPAKFITCLAQNRQGDIFVGTEDQGLFIGKPRSAGIPPADDPRSAGILPAVPQFQWSQHTAADLGGDNSVYATAIDRKNRVWLGTLNHGVTVMSGAKFQTYSVIADPSTNTLAGPLGARIFAIATNPKDGDIWIATDAGLARYSLKAESHPAELRSAGILPAGAAPKPSESPTTKSSNSVATEPSDSVAGTPSPWTYYTRGMSAGSPVPEATSLPSDQIAAIAFSKSGTLFAATQCDGLAIAQPADNYTSWKTIRGPDLVPTAPTGPGLPSNLCNAILVSHDGTIYLATTTGLAFSKDDGDSWQYIRGKDYLDKDRGFLTPRGIVPASLATYNQLLTEDYITNITEDSAGRLWIAHRATGYEAIDPQSTLKFASNSDSKIREKNGYVTAILSYRNAGRSAGILPAERTPPRSTAILPAESASPRSTAIPPAERSPRSAGILPADGSTAASPAYRSTAIPSANNQPAGRMPALQPAGETPALHATILIARYGAGLSQFNPPAPPHTEPRDSVAGPHKMKTTPGGLFLIPDDSPDPAGNPQASAPPRPNPNDHIFDADSAPIAAPLPLAAKPPTADELKKLTANLKSLPTARSPVVFLGDDWCTQGDWCNHIGRQFALLCAANWPFDDSFTHNDVFWATGNIDPRYESKDGMRRWLHWMNTDNPKCLYDPALGHRRQSSWDDHGEIYNRENEGPDLWITVHTPKGVHRVSMYFVNKDGHSQDRWSRDFLITVRAAGGTQTDPNPVLASARVDNFWGGVYKQFAVEGGVDYVFEIRRNYSFDTIVSGIFTDRLSGKPTDFEDLRCPMLEYVAYDPPDIPPEPPNSKGSALAPSEGFWEAGAAATSAGAYRPAASIYRPLAYRAAAASNAPQAVLDNWRWHMGLWTQTDKSQFDAKMAEGWRRLLTRDPTLLDFVTKADEQLKSYREKHNLGNN